MACQTASMKLAEAACVMRSHVSAFHNVSVLIGSSNDRKRALAPFDDASEPGSDTHRYQRPKRRVRFLHLSRYFQPRISLQHERPQVVIASREGDYADPHTSEESPRIMARRRGRRARLPAPLGFWTGWRRRRSGANGEQQKRLLAVLEPPHRWVVDRSAGRRQPVNASARSGLATPSLLPCL